MKPKRKQRQILDLEEAKIDQAKEIAKLMKRVKNLEKRRNARPTGLRRLKKERSIEDIDLDVEIVLFDESQGRMQDADVFGVDDLEGNELFVETSVQKEVSIADLVTTAGEIVTAARVEDSDAPITITTANVDDELTLENTLTAIKSAKPKVFPTAITTLRAKRIVFHEQVQLAEQIQAQEREQLSIKERSKILAELIELRRKYFAAKRVKEIRNKTPTKAQQRSLMCTYMRNMEGFKQKYFKGKIFDDIKKIFDQVYKRVNTFVDMDTENVEESLKKTKAEADDDTAKVNRFLEKVLKDDDDVVIEATPLSYKSPITFDSKIYIEGKKSYFKIIRERFKKTKPVDDMENLLLQTLKTMFEPHVEGIIWKY
nr:hypothetical protein [Tanacetum cinerariifolium]